MNDNTQNDNHLSADASKRLEARVDLMRSTLGRAPPIVGYARRITFNPKFMKVVRLLRTRMLRGRFIHRHKRSVYVRHAFAE